MRPLGSSWLQLFDWLADKLGFNPADWLLRALAFVVWAGLIAAAALGLWSWWRTPPPPEIPAGDPPGADGAEGGQAGGAGA